MENERCELCKYYDTAGYCLRYPPQVVLWPDDDLSSHNPYVKEDDWCGEFKRKEEEPERLSLAELKKEIDCLRKFLEEMKSCSDSKRKECNKTINLEEIEAKVAAIWNINVSKYPLSIHENMLIEKITCAVIAGKLILPKEEKED